MAYFASATATQSPPGPPLTDFTYKYCPE